MVKKLFHPRLSAAIALLVYGSWAGFTNRDYNLVVILKAFFTQGLFAFIATLLLGTAAQNLFRRNGADYKALFISFGVCFVIICCVPSTLHWLIGTPHIFYSVLPGLIWGSLYIGILLALHHKESRI